MVEQATFFIVWRRNRRQVFSTSGADSIVHWFGADTVNRKVTVSTAAATTTGAVVEFSHYLLQVIITRCRQFLIAAAPLNYPIAGAPLEPSVFFVTACHHQFIIHLCWRLLLLLLLRSSQSMLLHQVLLFSIIAFDADSSENLGLYDG